MGVSRCMENVAKRTRRQTGCDAAGSGGVLDSRTSLWRTLAGSSAQRLQLSPSIENERRLTVLSHVLSLLKSVAATAALPYPHLPLSL